jgi:hypothetical protein
MDFARIERSTKLAAYLGRRNGTLVKQAIEGGMMDSLKGLGDSAMSGLKGLGNNALDYYKGLDPTAQAAILGGGVGAGVGGIGNALFGKRKKGVGILGRLGRGALAGGAVGGLGGAGINEAAIRLGMHGAGASDRGYHLSQTGGASGYNGSQLPTDLAHSYLDPYEKYNLQNKQVNMPASDVEPR